METTTDRRATAYRRQTLPLVLLMALMLVALPHKASALQKDRRGDPRGRDGR